MANFLKYKVNLPGPYHIKKGIPCQDAYCIREAPDGVIVAAVADGLGSEAHSDKGAKIASNSVVTYCKQNYKLQMVFYQHFFEYQHCNQSKNLMFD